MSGHTPGPWQCDGKRQPITGGMAMYWIVPKKLSVATGNPADARLIATAPEMLELLRALLRTRVGFEGDSPIDDGALVADSLLDEARALLARIDGAPDK